MALARFSLPRRGFYQSALAPMLPLADVLAGQFFPRDFRRYDLLIRARVVRAWLTDDSDREAAEQSYALMQQLRGASLDLSRFRALVEGVRSSGLDPDYPVGLSPHGPLLDGAHRVAVALVTGERKIAVDVRNSRIPPDYSRAWLAEAGMPEPDLSAADLLLDEFLANTGHDVLVVGSGVSVDDLVGVCQPGATVISSREVSLDQETAALLDDAMTAIPWRQHHTAPATSTLQAGPQAILRIRLPRPHWHRLPGTHVRVSELAAGFRENAQATGMPVVVGLTWSNNANGVAVLDGAGVRVWGSAGER